MRIAISGAGVDDPTLAHWLHRTGHVPTLIERAPRFRTGPGATWPLRSTPTIESDIESIFSDSITAVDEHPQGVRLEFENAPPREFDLLIDADGLHSNVRNLTFGPETRFERRTHGSRCAPHSGESAA